MTVQFNEQQWDDLNEQAATDETAAEVLIWLCGQMIAGRSLEEQAFATG